MHKRETRTAVELKNGKKSVFAWIEAANKDWIARERKRTRRSVAGVLDTLIEEARLRQEQDRAAVPDLKQVNA